MAVKEETQAEKRKDTAELEHGDDDYRESEDEDFDPNAPVQEESSDSEGEADSDAENDTKSQVKTRQQLKDEASKDKYDKIGEIKSSVDVNSLWAQMNKSNEKEKKEDPAADGKDASSSAPAATDTIEINRKFEFAGEVHTERKTVSKSSAEGKQYLEEKAQHEQEPHKRKAGPRKKKRSLLGEFESGKAKKMNTLEKSKLDWMGFVDKEGIKDDLEHHNKGGYLQQQDFLARVEHRQDSLRKGK